MTLGNILAILMSLAAMWLVYATVSVKLLKKAPWPLKTLPKID